MKKPILLLLLVLGVTLWADNGSKTAQPTSNKLISSEEPAVRKLFDAYLQQLKDLKINESIFTQDYTSTASDGTVAGLKEQKILLEFLRLMTAYKLDNDFMFKLVNIISNDTMLKITKASKEDAVAIKALKGVFHPQATLSSAIKAYQQTPGSEPVSAEEMAEFKKMENSPEGKILLEEIRQSIRNTFAESLKAMTVEMANIPRDYLNTFAIKSIKITGDRATVVSTTYDTNEKKLEETTWELVKKDGKWLISKDKSQYANTKNDAKNK